MKRTTKTGLRDVARAATEALAPRPERRNPDGFEALDPVMQKWVDVKGTLAIMATLLDDQSLTEEAAETMRRHIDTDAAALDAALNRAWDQLVKAGVPA